MEVDKIDLKVDKTEVKKVANMASMFETKTNQATEYEKSGSEYFPNKEKYHPIKDACWSKGQM
jgi:hypothetical protein